MTPTSRRRFLYGAATFAVTTAACASDCPGSSSGNATPGNQTAGGATPCTPASAPPIDLEVASSYLRYQRFLNPVLTGKPSAVLLMYGLVCADFGEKELLFPNTTGVGNGVHQHRARLWIRNDRIDTGSIGPDGTMSDSSESFAFWNVAKHVVTIQGLDTAGTAQPSSSGPLAWRNDPEHPWNNAKWVRCLSDISGLAMIPAASRNNPAIVTSRVTLTDGTVIAIPPFTERGRNTRWKLVRANGTSMESATTDAMVWQREYPAATAKYSITLTPMPSGTPKVIRVKANDKKQLIAVVTHAMTGGTSSPAVLTDNRAFAQLLVTGNPAMFPTPTAFLNGPEAGMSLSGSDGHCECACN